MNRRLGKVAIGVLITLMVAAIGSEVAMGGVGNALPSGPHYNLNLIGMEKGKNPNMGCGEGHRIFVRLDKNDRISTRILLSEGDFGVVDCDGTDGAAAFRLPNPDPDNTGTTVYSVYLRLRGKPGGDIIMETCATDPLIDEEVCSDLKVVMVRTKGKGSQKFTNVSKELLYIYAYVCTAVDDAGECTNYEYMRVPLFSDLLEGYFWNYDNNGVRIAQLRFYEGVPTEVPDVLDSIAPDSGAQGQTNLDVILTASGVDFTAGATPDVDFGDGITVNSVNVDSPTQLTANIDIAGDAEAGKRIVTVTLEDGTQLIIPFTVTTP